MQNSTRHIKVSGIAILRPRVKFRLAGLAFEFPTGFVGNAVAEDLLEGSGPERDVEGVADKVGVDVDSMGIMFCLSPLSNFACETEKLEFS